MKTLNAQKFRQMVKASALVLSKHIKYINSLNVFPVPDGDTGSNLSATLSSGNQYVEKDKNNNVGKLSQDFAQGLLMGARGNSGVITSQIFRGWSQSISNQAQLSASNIANAFSNSAKVAYKAVMNPTEGTILSVIRKTAHAGQHEIQFSQDIIKLFHTYVKASSQALKATTNELPVLKKVGVVDSGGQGLALIFQAWSDVIDGTGLKQIQQPTPEEMAELIEKKHHHSAQGQLNPSKIKYQYCTQMTVRFGRGQFCQHKFSYQPFYDYLATLGDSLLVANDSHVVKVHVHTNTPWKVLKFGQTYGDLTKVKVDNMVKQQEDIINHNHKQKSTHTKQKHVHTAIISISTGNGVAKLFSSLGVTANINGGQTMNPNTKDIYTAIKNINADNVIILPNNSNIFMATELACKKSNHNTSNKHAGFIKTKDIQQGMASMLGYNPKASLSTNQKAMNDSIDCVSGAITQASRSQNIDNVDVQKGAIIGIQHHKILEAGGSLFTTTVKTIEDCLKQANLAEVITIIYQSKDDKDTVNKIVNQLSKEYSDLEFETHYGGQAVYNILFSIE